MKNISTPLISAVCFILTFLGYVGLQFAPHVTAGMDNSLYGIMALCLGHALGSATSGGTVANISIPGSASASGVTTSTGG
jgi:hypothetical protein